MDQKATFSHLFRPGKQECPKYVICIEFTGCKNKLLEGINFLKLPTWMKYTALVSEKL